MCVTYQVSFKICERAEKGKNERSIMPLRKVNLKKSSKANGTST